MRNQNLLRGRVIWITGLSCAGKSTVASKLADKLCALGVIPVIIDGDRIRSLLPRQFGYSAEDRRQLASFYSNLSRELSSQGHLVICATISLFRTVQEWNRQNIPKYFEIWLRVPLQELKKRDRNDLYVSDGARRKSDVIGFGVLAEFPQDADMVIDNYGDMTPDAACALIYSALLGKTYDP